jgi:Spy/CpxP family protein refolding chaperone
MNRTSWSAIGLGCVLTLALAGRVTAQQHEQHHPGGAQTSQEQPASPGMGAPAPAQLAEQTQGMMEDMQGMMEDMQSMMEHMRGMMSRRGMMGRGGMMARRGATEERQEDGEAESPRGGMMGMGGMMGRHLERLTQQLELTSEQQAQVRTLVRNHAKEAIRLRADSGVLAVDVRQLLDTDPIDLPKVKQLLQSITAKEADLRLAHITLMQEVNKLLRPEQQKKFRAMRENMMDMGGMMGMMGGGMMGGGMMGRGRGER